MQISRAIDSMPPRYRNAFTVLTARDVTTMSDLHELVRSEEADHPGVAVFITLDDLDQALYTSMHATESDELTIETDSDTDPAAPDSLGDPHDDDASERRQFAHTSAQLANPALRVTWAELRNTREGSDDDVDVIVAMNENPLDLLDEVVLLLHVPTDDATAAIAAIPNGYFDGDWNVFQNHAVALHLANGFGYRPLGVGASWIGFIRDAPLQPNDADRLVSDLAELYGARRAAGWARLREVLSRQTTLFLGYTDNFAE